MCDAELNEIGAPDFVVQGSYGTNYPLTDAANPGIQGNLTAMGVPTIVVGYTDTTTSVNRGLIEQIERYEQLAKFLGVTDAAENSATDKAHLCAAVESFKHIAPAARNKGVRSMGTFAPCAHLRALAQSQQPAHLPAQPASAYKTCGRLLTAAAHAQISPLRLLASWEATCTRRRQTWCC